MAARPTSARAGSISLPRTRSKKIRCACCAPHSSPRASATSPRRRRLEAMRAAAPLVAHASRPSASTTNCKKLFGLAPKPSIGLRLLRGDRGARAVWPELLEGVGVEQNEWHAYDVWQHNLATLDATPPGDATFAWPPYSTTLASPERRTARISTATSTSGPTWRPTMLQRLRFSERDRRHGRAPRAPAHVRRRIPS